MPNKKIMIKMKQVRTGIGFMLTLAILSSCSLSKMVQLAEQQDLQVDPDPLEVHGGKVPFTMSAVLPPKMLPSGKVWTINTFYQYDDKEFQVGSVEFKADDFPSSSSSTSRKSENFVFDYRDDLNPGKLVIQGVASDPRNGNSKSTAKMDVATGIITTSQAVKNVYLVAYADHGYNDQEELIPTNVEFFFPQGRSTLVGSLDTDGTSNRTKQQNLGAFIAEKNVTRTVTITGTHSPEGTERVNSNLSQDRAEAIEKYYRAQMKKYDYQGVADSIGFILKPVVEDWAGFTAALNSYDGLGQAEKADIMGIVRGTGTFEDKEKALRKLDSYDKLLKDVYPPLRTAKTEILTVKPKKSNAEIAVLAKGITEGNVAADTLSEEELMFAGTLTPSADEKIAIYTAATKKSGSWQAHNNLAAAHLQKGLVSLKREQLAADALTQLEIAANKNAAAEVHANMAAAYIMQNEFGKAYESLTAAFDKNPSNSLKADINTLRGMIEIRQGNYNAAKSSLSSGRTDGTALFDRGLAHLLSKDYAAADTFFGDAAKTEALAADSHYYKAVTAARRNNAAEITSNLAEAVKRNSKLKDKALNDLEFANYANAVSEGVK